MNADIRLPALGNEPVLSYAPGSRERATLRHTLVELTRQPREIPVWIGGREVRTGRLSELRSPHRHALLLARVHEAGEAETAQAIDAAVTARRTWGELPFTERAAVFLRAAELLSTHHRARLNAATMLGQSKTAHQAEIDSACELIDFLRFNVTFAERLYQDQPLSPQGTWNRIDYRPLEGFVYAVTPFNFTAIAGNLPTAPALMGNTVVWKPARSAVYSAWFIVELLREAGLPDGVINFLPGPAGPISEQVLAHRDLAGVHFTGSTRVFNGMWRTIGERIDSYRSYPRLVGETGGKDFIVAHPSADPSALATAIVRGGFEYQGQKCSAASRIYVPEGMWAEVRDRLVAMIADIRMGDVTDFKNFMGAVIDRPAYDRISGYLSLAHETARVLAGGKADDSEGYFVQPTLVEVSDPKHRLMGEEIFGPVVSAYVYPDRDWKGVLELVDGTSPYALTGAVFARDRIAIMEAQRALRNAAGNFYINDKPTGAVVGQQPFGGARASGTNDKAGSFLNLVRWTSARTIKETFVPPIGHRYAFMDEDPSDRP